MISVQRMVLVQATRDLQLCAVIGNLINRAYQMHVTDTQADPTTDGLRESFKRLGLTLSFDSIETILIEAGVDVTPPAPDRASIDVTLLHHQ